jgi:hypothetical protein
MTAPVLYTTLEDHLQLLEERGYLSDNFLSGHKVASWKQEFTKDYEGVVMEAIDTIGKFSKDLSGRFDDIDLVKLNFRFSYHPDNDVLKLNSLYSRMGGYNKPYYFGQSSDLPEATDVYGRLYDIAREQNNVSTLIQSYRDYTKEKNPANDYDPNHVHNDYDLDKLLDPDPNEDPDAKKNYKKLRLAPDPDVKSHAWPRLRRR